MMSLTIATYGFLISCKSKNELADIIFVHEYFLNPYFDSYGFLHALLSWRWFIWFSLVQTPLKRPQSPKLGRNPSNNTMQGLASHPTSTYLTKNGSYKYSGKKNCPKPINSQTLPTVVSHDQNSSPNIQHQFGVSPN